VSLAAKVTWAVQRAKFCAVLLATNRLDHDSRILVQQYGLAGARVRYSIDIHHAKAIVALVQQLSDEVSEQLLQDALAATRTIEYEGSRAEVLAVLAPTLNGKGLKQALSVALAIQDERSRANVLAALAPWISGKELKQALGAALAIQGERSRADVLVALAPRLSGKDFKQALSAVLEIQNDFRRFKTLIDLVLQREI
jgi:hypothetical protein